LILALAVVAAGVFVMFEAVTGPGNPGYAEVGPGVIPGVIGGVLSLAGLALLVQAVRGQWQVVWFERFPILETPDASSAHPRGSGNPEAAPSELTALGPRLRGDERISREPLRNVLLIAAALLLDVVLLAPLGFIVASAVLFALVATAFGSRRIVLDAALGLAFSGAIYFVFVYGLGLSLPVGSVWGSLPWTS
jgi:putative tricarboxylic transport membrane protein